MVVLLVGIPGVEAGVQPRSDGNLKFVAVESVAEALAFLERNPCDTVMIGPDVADTAPERLSALADRVPHQLKGFASTDARSSDAGARDRDVLVDSVFRRGSIRDMEKLMIMDRLAQLNQNRTRSAESLDISVRTLRNKLRDYRSQVALVGVDSESS